MTYLELQRQRAIALREPFFNDPEHGWFLDKCGLHAYLP